MKHTHVIGMSLRYIPEVVNLHNQTGKVDMQQYMSWLRGHGYVFAGDY